MIFAIVIFLVETVTSPVAPWWAGPAYVASLERIVITFITIGVPALGTVWVQVHYGRASAKDRLEKRAESHREHERGLTAAREREIALAAKVDATALHMADTVAQTKHETLAAIEQNTALTINAADASKEAAKVANDVNAKLIETNAHVAETNQRFAEAIKAKGAQPEAL